MFVALAFILMLVLDPWLDMTRNPYLLFFGAITVSAWYGGSGAGILATLLSAVLSARFFIEPTYGFEMDFAATVRTIIFVLQGWAIAGLCGALRSAEERTKVSLQQLQASETRFRRLVSSNISPQFLPHVFEYFRQADGTTTRTFGGLGLGLAIARHLTELHGGTVWAQSPGEGQGATFTVRFPAMVSVAKTFPSDRSSTTMFDLSGLRVLLVDDEADMRDLAVAILKEYGAEVRVTGSATEALLVLDQFKPNVLISDIGMPEVDGYTLMRQIREKLAQQGEQIRAIALTAYAGEVDRQRALSAGFEIHLAKPIEPEQLVKAIASFFP